MAMWRKVLNCSDPSHIAKRDGEGVGGHVSFSAHTNRFALNVCSIMVKRNYSEKHLL